MPAPYVRSLFVVISGLLSSRLACGAVESRDSHTGPALPGRTNSGGGPQSRKGQNHARRIHTSRGWQRPDVDAGQGEAKKKVSAARRAAIARSRSKHLGGVPAGKAAVISQGGVRYIDRADAPPEGDEPAEAEKPKRPRRKRPRRKHDPKYIAAARELRDRYLEEMNAPGSDFSLPPAAHGKYDVSRQLESAPTELEQTPLLDAA
jgi:hypothetical protein